MHIKENKYFYFLLLINTILRLSIVIFTSLGIDEAYYFSYSIYLDWSYFDHPLMIGLLIKISTFIFGFNSEFAIRFFALFLGTLNLILIYHIAKSIKDNTAGLYAALLYSASFYCSVISGSFILPDTPLSFFWLLSIFFFVKFLNTQQKKWVYIILFGIAVGLAFLSKYSAMFLWFGILCFAIKEKKLQLLNKPYLYVSVFISIIFFLPVIIWNYYNAFESLFFHSNRIDFSLLSIRFNSFATELIGQIFYNNPVNFFIIIACLFFFIKNKKIINESSVTFLLFISLPVIIITLIVSLFNNTLPHWSGPGYIGLIIIAAVILSFKNHKIISFKVFKYALISNLLFLIVIVLGLLQVNFGIIGIKTLENEEKLGKNDLSLDLYGWHQIQQKSIGLVEYDLKNSIIDSNFVLITHNWFPAGSIEYYIANPLKRKLYVWGTKQKAHQYIKINKLRGKIIKSTDAYYITTSRYFKPPDDLLINNFESTEKRECIEVTRNSKTVYYLFFYRLKNAKLNF